MRRMILLVRLVKKGMQIEAEVVVISGDKDLTQLASDNTTVFITRKGMTDIEKYTPDTCHGEIRY